MTRSRNHPAREYLTQLFLLVSITFCLAYLSACETHQNRRLSPPEKPQPVTKDVLSLRSTVTVDAPQAIQDATKAIREETAGARTDLQNIERNVPSVGALPEWLRVPQRLDRIDAQTVKQDTTAGELRALKTGIDDLNRKFDENTKWGQAGWDSSAAKDKELAKVKAELAEAEDKRKQAEEAAAKSPLKVGMWGGLVLSAIASLCFFFTKFDKLMCAGAFLFGLFGFGVCAAILLFFGWFIFAVIATLALAAVGVAVFAWKRWGKFIPAPVKEEAEADVKVIAAHQERGEPLMPQEVRRIETRKLTDSNYAVAFKKLADQFLSESNHAQPEAVA